MLFWDNKLTSEFDFGNTVSDGNASLNNLADEIFRVAQVIAETDQTVYFKHTDNYGESLYVQVHPSKGEESLCERSPESIRQLLVRKDKTSIAGFLTGLGIEKPDENSSDFKEYLQLLYFFYMMRYFAFENDSFFRMFMKRPTSELSPVKGASQGKYLCFVLENLMDDEKSSEIFIKQDFGYSAFISIITDRIDTIINGNSIWENEKRAKEIDKEIKQVLDGCNEVPPREWNGGLILRAMDAVYQYQMLGYSGDMIRNMTKKERIFDFPELEIGASLKWEKRLLKFDQLEDFLKEKEVATFCTQNNNLVRADKALRNGPSEIVKYIFREDQQREGGLFIQKGEDGEDRISALMAAVIVRTYLDLAGEKLLVDIKQKNGWNHEVAFKNSLVPSKSDSRLSVATDLAYRLFAVAVHSEFLNTTIGHGYWSLLFGPVYLRAYVYVQRCVYLAFSGRNPNEWRDRLVYFITELPLYSA